MSENNIITKNVYEIKYYIEAQNDLIKFSNTTETSYYYNLIDCILCSNETYRLVKYVLINDNILFNKIKISTCNSFNVKSSSQYFEILELLNSLQNITIMLDITYINIQQDDINIFYNILLKLLNNPKLKVILLDDISINNSIKLKDIISYINNLEKDYFNLYGLYLNSYKQNNITYFSDLLKFIKKSFITKLNLNNIRLTQEDLLQLFNSLNANTTINKLTLNNILIPINYLTELIVNNKIITRLNISNINLNVNKEEIDAFKQSILNNNVLIECNINI